MYRILRILTIVLLFGTTSYAQADSSRLRISLLTCGPGDEIWAHFGHIAIRVTDSVQGTDLVYNYGTFAFGEEVEFAIKFMRGKLPYYVSYYPFPYFLDEYTDPERRVEEQVLQVGGKEKESIRDYLVENAREENRYYRYDFFFDNCSSRIRDVFKSSLGSDFQYGQVLPAGSQLTYRQIMNEYFYSVHFVRLGCNLLLGSPIDRVMTNEQVMFVPDFMRNGLAGATINGRPAASAPKVLIEGPAHEPAGTNWAFISLALVLLLTVVGLSMPGARWLGNIMTFLILFVTGLLGCLMLFMWLGTDHQGCANNYNVLWALPTNLLLAFVRKGGKDKYAWGGIALIFVSILLHLLHVQQLPLFELTPLLLAQLFVFGSIVKRNR